MKDENILIFYEGLWGMGKSYTLEHVHGINPNDTAKKYLRGFRFCKYMSILDQYKRHLDKNIDRPKEYICDRSPYSVQGMAECNILNPDTNFLGIEKPFSEENRTRTIKQIKNLVNDFEDFLLEVSELGKIRFEIILARNVQSYYDKYIIPKKQEWYDSKSLNFNAADSGKVLNRLIQLQDHTLNSCLNLKERAKDKNSIEVIIRYTHLYPTEL